VRSQASAAPAAQPSSAPTGEDPRLRSDPLAAALHRSVARRGAKALIARQLHAEKTKDSDYVGSFVSRVSDDTRFMVESVTHAQNNSITHFELKASPGDERVTVAVTDPEYWWYAKREAGKTAWARRNAVPQVAQAPAGLQVTVAQTHTGPYYTSVNQNGLVTLPAGAPALDKQTEWRLAGSQIRYCQDSIDYVFSGRTPGGAGNLDAAVANLKSDSNRDTLDTMPALRLIITHTGKIVTLDNRRLWVVKKAQVGPAKVRWATRQEYKTDYETLGKFTAGDFGKDKIRVRNAPW
jgi:hypothetical protein